MKDRCYACSEVSYTFAEQRKRLVNYRLIRQINRREALLTPLLLIKSVNFMRLQVCKGNCNESYILLPTFISSCRGTYFFFNNRCHIKLMVVYHFPTVSRHFGFSGTQILFIRFRMEIRFASSVSVPPYSFYDHAKFRGSTEMAVSSIQGEASN